MFTRLSRSILVGCLLLAGSVAAQATIPAAASLQTTQSRPLYLIVVGKTYQQLTVRVLSLMAQGYIPAGGVSHTSIANGNNTPFYQAMVARHAYRYAP